ncbi:MAG TPA: hypothetical protein PK206_01945 [Chitinophagales bacterium]|nr:hypothetical protein [Chitinophagales bacterium]
MKSQIEDKFRWYVLIAMLYFIYVLLMHKWGHQGDMTFWMNWSKYIFTHGITHIYELENCNYLPAYLYVLWLHTHIQGNFQDIGDNLYTIKYFTLLFDFGAAYFAVYFVPTMRDKIFYFFVLLLNAAFIYNTVFWGQVDAIYTCFGFVALIMAIKNRTVISIICLALALNFKLQALVFVPIITMILCFHLLQHKSYKKILIGILCAIVLQIFILLPFILHHQLPKIIAVITNTVGFYNFPTLGAFNFWSLMLPNVSIEGMYQISDNVKFGFLTYHQIGLLLFFVLSFAALFPFLHFMYKQSFITQDIQFPIKYIFLITALCSINFYFFNTQMHERYVHPAIVLIATYSFMSKRYGIFLILSIAYFLNLERICWYLHLHNETYLNGLLFKPRLIAVLYLFVILQSYYYLYFDKSKQETDISLA